MATLEIRRRGETGGGVLPQVRQVDYSGIGNNALTRYQAQGGMGTDIQNAVKGIAHGLDQTVGVLNARDERDATLLAAKMQSNLANEKAKFLLEIERNPTLADSAVDRWGAIVKEQQAKAAKELGGGQESYRRKCFERATQTFLDNNAIEVLRTSSKIADKYTQDVASAGLDLAMQALVDATEATQKEASDNLSAQFEVAANAYRWSAEEKLLKWEQLIEKTGEARAMRAIASATADKDLELLYNALSTINNKDASEENKKKLKEIFGLIDPKRIKPEHLQKLTDSITTKRYRLQSVKSNEFKDVIAKTHNLFIDGQVDSNSVEQTIRQLSAKGAPESSLTQLHTDLAKLRDKEAGEMASMVYDTVALMGEYDDGNWNRLVERVPENIRKNPEFIRQANALKKYGREVVDATNEARVSEQADMILYGEDLMVTSISDREQLLRELSATNPKYYPPEKMRADLKKLESMKKENRADLINRVSWFMKDVVGDTSISQNNVFLSDLTGRYGGEAKEGEAFLRKTFDDAKEKDVREAWKQFSEGTSRWLDACDENPTWTDQQRAELYYDTVIQPVFGRLANTKLHQDELTWRLTIQKTNQWLDSLREVGMSKVGEDASYKRYSSDRTKADPSATQKSNNPNRKKN